MSSHGYHVGGFVGFLNAISELAMKFNPAEIIMVWGDIAGHEKHHQTSRTTKSGLPRQNLNRFYEADIPDTPENRNEQIKKIVAVLKCLPVRQIYVADFKVEKTISVLLDILKSKQAFDATTASTSKFYIISSNKNLYQLIDESTKIWSPGQKKTIDSEACKKDFFVWPHNFCIARSIAGDGDHRIVGIPGWGFKKVTKYIPQIASNMPFSYNDLETMVSNAKPGSSFIETIREHLETISSNVANLSLARPRDDTSSETKIHFVYDSDRGKGKPNKIELFRQFSKEGLTTFNVDLLFSSIKHGIKIS